MKKRLLITSIVMMLVVAVALSTATYAWFTANTSVKADAVVLTASTMEGDAIMISRSANNSGLSNTITLATTSDKLYPATPNAADALTAATDAKFINLQVDGTNAAKKITKTSGNVSYYTDTFYVYNKGFSAVTLAPTVTIYFNNSIGASSDAAKAVRIAIVESVGTEVASSDVNFAAAELKNIYQFDTTAASTSALENAVVEYVAAPSTFNPNIDEYFSDDEGTPFTTATITAQNYDTYKASLYVVKWSVTHKNIATAGALATYGAYTTDTGEAITENSVYHQGDNNEGIAYSSNGYEEIAAPTSNHYVANKYTVIVWLEGWDTECTNAMSAGLFRVDVSFTKAA